MIEYAITDADTEDIGPRWFDGHIATLEEAQALAPQYPAAEFITEYRYEDKGWVPTGRRWPLQQPKPGRVAQEDSNG